MQAPEALARKNIDKLLTECGWVIQDYKQLDLSAGRGIAIREVPLKRGRTDYLLLVDRKPIGIVEAKKEGVTLSSRSRHHRHRDSRRPPGCARPIRRNRE